MSWLATFPQELSERLHAAAEKVGLAEHVASHPIEVHEATDPRFGDYQSNIAMKLAKALKQNPRELAVRLIEHCDVSGIAAPPEVAGAGFINFRVLPEALAARAMRILQDERLGVAPTTEPQTIVIDFSSPNIAKQMHVGHIRSTILGDALARIARFLGHRVITDNHIGDWGTQFGKVIYGWKTLRNAAALQSAPVAELVRIYREVNALASADPEIEELCRQELVKLQQGDAENLAIWRQCVELSMKEFNELYDLLDVRFDHVLGESHYNPLLADTVMRLEAAGLAERSEGALVAWMPHLSETPFIVRKSDGAFNYATTDIATIEYRTREWKADAIWYVVGAPQQLHFKMLFELARRMGITAQLEHIAFGSILGEDRKLMKTRSGDNVSLRDVLTEAIARAATQVRERNPDLSPAEQEELGQIIGLGAVKYAELSQHRMTDYVFSWERMLSLQGNTAPYLQNACVRIKSIFRKLDADNGTPCGELQLELRLIEPAERALARRCISYAEAVPLVLDGWRPNLLANTLYELANAFHTFYEACPVLKSVGATRASRLALCLLSLRILEHGLGLLGIRVPDKM